MGRAAKAGFTTRSSWTESNRPVESVNWYDAMAFCRWLSAKTGQEIRLPTEQEWEKAATGYGWSGISVGRVTKWAMLISTKRCGNAETYNLQETSAVGIYPQGESPYGLMDMSGNVWEWCLNKYEEPQMTTPDLSGGVRVVRGGAWYYGSGYCRSSFRDHSYPDDRNLSQGFRLLCCFPH